MLTVVVIAKNEEDRINACLESVKWADEIIVLDNGSTDHTIEIAKKYTDRIISLQNTDFAFIRNKAMEKAKGDWVLYVDADERAIASLKNEIESVIKDDRFSALAISRKNVIFGIEQKYGPFWPDWVIRLLKKSDFIKWVGKIHEFPQFKGKLGYSKNSLLHLTHRNIDQIILKSLEWSKLEAGLRLDINHPRMSGWRFLRIFITEVFKQGVLRKGFFHGTISMMDSILQAFSLYMTYVRLWELQQPKSRPQIYEEIDKKLIENGFNY